MARRLQDLDLWDQGELEDEEETIWRLQFVEVGAAALSRDRTVSAVRHNVWGGQSQPLHVIMQRH